MIVTHRFKAGEVVFERTRPNQRMVIIDCNGHIYTCVTQDSIKGRKLIFPARELKTAS